MVGFFSVFGRFLFGGGGLLVGLLFVLVVVVVVGCVFLRYTKITVFQTETKLHSQDSAILPFGITVTAGLLKAKRG